MPELKFKPPIWITVYITVLQYLIGLAFVPILMFFLPLSTNLLISLFIFVGVLAVTREAYIEGLVLFSNCGLRSYALGQFGKSSHFLLWDEIYKVEPYRYFGLRFFLIRYHSADTPLWLPLFLVSQTQLNLLILEYTSEDNPLHKALLERNFFKKVLWHSAISKHKSDRYILESAYTDRIHNSFRKYCLSFLIPLWIFVALLAFITEQNLLSRFFWTHFAILSGFTILPYLLFWYLFVSNNYIALKQEGIELHSHLGESFVPWLMIREIKIHGFGVFQELRIWLKEPVGKISFVPIPLRFIDRRTLKRSILQTHFDNPLRLAVIKYL